MNRETNGEMRVEPVVLADGTTSPTLVRLVVVDCAIEVHTTRPDRHPQKSLRVWGDPSKPPNGSVRVEMLVHKDGLDELAAAWLRDRQGDGAAA